MAFLLENNQKNIESFSKGVLPLLGIIGVYCGLIILQPDLSTATIFAAVLAAMIFIAGMKYRHIFTLGGLGVLAIAAAILYRGADGDNNYRYRRFVGFFNPFDDATGTGWQAVQSQLALGSGGLFGVGFTSAILNKRYLPEPVNDFIFATIGEEFGFLGTSAVVILYIILLWRCFRIAINAPDLFSCLMVSGFTILFSAQVVINIGVVTASMPVTGIPLPFISYGGNAMVTSLGAIGIILNVSKKTVER